MLDAADASAATEAGFDHPEEDARLAFLRSAIPDALRYEVFALLRQAEALSPERPRIGRSRLPAQNVADLTQAPILAFPETTLASIAVRGDRAEVRGYYLGLTGPMAPLPLHLTEFAHYEERYAKSRPFGAFLDMLAGRMLQFFFRAWADSQPASHADRPGDDRFATYLAALSGAMEGATESDAFPARARLHYVPLFAGRRSAGAIEDSLRHLLMTEVTIHAFEPRWRDIAPGDRTRLGIGGGFATLGVDAVAGSRVRQVSDAFRATIRTRSFRDYEAFLPTGRKYAVAADALDAFAPTHLEWRIELELPASELRPARLGGAIALGWTSWLGGKQSVAGDAAPAYRADARLTRKPRKAARHTGGVHHG